MHSWILEDKLPVLHPPSQLCPPQGRQWVRGALHPPVPEVLLSACWILADGWLQAANLSSISMPI